MQKQDWTWTTHRLPQPARLVRWGHFGRPVLIFPTAGGDCEEIERLGLIGALAELIERGRMKAYSVDGLWARAWLAAETRPRGQCEPDKAADESSVHDSYVYEEVLPRIREDCQDAGIEPTVAGASRGAAIAIGTLCRHPDAFRAAVCLSGVYQMDAITCQAGVAQPSRLAPLSCLANLGGQSLARLRQRTMILGCGQGDYENPTDSRLLSEALIRKGVACRLDLWGPERDHSWSTWRDLFPRLLAEQL